MKKLVLVIMGFMLVSSLCSAQGPEVISEYGIKMKGELFQPEKYNANQWIASPSPTWLSSKDKREMIPIINRKTNDFVILLIDKKTISGLFYNSAFELLAAKTIATVNKEQNQVLGGLANDLEYTIFMTNSKKTTFSSITFSLLKNEIVSHDFTELKLEKEKIVDSYSRGENLLVLTTLKTTSILKAYLFKPNQFEVKTFDLSAYPFGDTRKDLSYALTTTGNTGTEEVTPIYKETYNGLDLASSKRKIYYNDSEIIITMDGADIFTAKQTRIITLNISDGKSKVRYVRQPAISCANTLNNTFIFDSKFFQITACKDEMAIYVSNLNSSELIKEFRIKKGDSIDFKNSPIYQEGSAYFSSVEKSYDNTKKFLNKITDAGSDLGIAVNQQNESNIEVIIGAKKTFQHGSPGGSFSGGSTFSTPYGNVTTPPSYNPTNYGYQSYGTQRTTFFKSILQINSFNKTDEKDRENVFDQITKYEKDSDVARTVFKIGNDFILGLYNESNKTYKLVRFK